MRLFKIILLCAVVFSFSSCEELIDVDLNSADPKIVIVADINNSGNVHEVFVSRTVNFDVDRPSDPVENAAVQVRSGAGQVYVFLHQGDGRYVNTNMQLGIAETYSLSVTVDGEEYKSETSMPEYVEVDSIGVTKENIFNETYYFVNLKFQDPPGQANYFKYTVSVNEEKFKFDSATSDKFNDGKLVTHQIGSGGNDEIQLGDKLVVRRQAITKPVYTYWSEYMMTNPGSAAPGNPTSNISNGALGYFSVANVRDYSIDIQDETVSEEIESESASQ
ncbi:DUF4249 domain-containing protein [Sphingobacterium lactis]|uniref:DUF4249 domain-containing protein n=1 Tax=Sphingobacterium lactis TaxID=797291 RepID=A0A1H5U0A0_9SPHI|nr:DUF4249 domain-containing protein [Sphingobacterium lactis]SEF68552.1 protein of unknown function [Sphingobacterium lactis]